MKKKIIIIFGFIVLLLLIITPSEAASLSERLCGKILLQVEEHGEAWYVYPEVGSRKSDIGKRFYLGRPADAFQIMRELGLGISEKDFDIFAGSAPQRLSGMILLRVEANGEAYYVNPDDLKMHYLGRPADAFQIMRELGLGVTNQDLAQIPSAGPSYKYVTQKPTGWFKTGQEADLVLYATGFNESGGPTTLNHPGKVTTDGTHLIVSDTWNNRVLIWNKIPSKNNEPPDLVLGQPNFNTNIARLGADGMNWPMGVATDGEKLLVGDANNNRVLIWNTFPTRNGQPADLVLGAPDFETWISPFAEIYPAGERNPQTFTEWTWDVWTDGDKVAVAGGGDVLIWNHFPTQNEQPADIILGAESFETRYGGGSTIEYGPNPLATGISPDRGVSSDGTRLVATSYNDEAIFVWNEFPTRSGEPASFRINLQDLNEHYPDENIAGLGAMGVELKDGKLFVAATAHILVWDEFPQSAQDLPSLILGAEKVNEEIQVAVDKRLFFPNNFGHPFGMATNGEKFFVADTGNSRVLIYNKIPTRQDEEADVIIGTPEIYLSKKSFGAGPLPFSDGQHLFVGVDGYGVWIYNQLPDESKAPADVVLGLHAFPGDALTVGGDVTSDGKKLFMIYREDKSRILIWNKIPDSDNQPADIIIGGQERDGRSGLHDSSKIASNGQQLFVNDAGNNRVLVWNQIPTTSQALPDFVLGQDNFDLNESGSTLNRFNSPAGLSADNEHLAIADMENQRVLIWNLPITKNGQAPNLVLKEMIFADREEPLHFNLPLDVEVYGDKLFVTAGGRIFIWSEFPQSDNTPPDIVLGQKDFYDHHPFSNRKDYLFTPAALSFDGSFLWVGETKWSYRLLRFSVQPN